MLPNGFFELLKNALAVFVILTEYLFVFFNKNLIHSAKQKKAAHQGSRKFPDYRIIASPTRETIAEKNLFRSLSAVSNLYV